MYKENIIDAVRINSDTIHQTHISRYLLIKKLKPQGFREFILFLRITQG